MELKKKLIDLDIFEKDKIVILYDSVINIKKLNLKKVNLAFSLIKRFDEETNCRKYLSILNKFIYD
jgi:hypothetical protein